MTTVQMCDHRQLDALLDGALVEAEEHDVARHLDECARCREYLETRAAAPKSWREAGELLVMPEFDDSAVETSSSPPLIIRNVLDALAPTDDPGMIGRLGGMEISGVIGAGAMGVVLKGFDRSLDRPVAIKVLAPHLASSGAARQRFSREAKAAAAVLHPNVMSIHSVSTDGPLPWLVMPCVRGNSLQHRLNDEGPLPIREVLRIGAQIASGLAAAHAQGLVHRDIKPANIMLEDGVERVAITDFGLARAVDDATMTRSGVIAGTPQYMSPEQARGESIDQRSDLFSLGSVMYAMCAGRAPFRAETMYGVLRRITDDDPTPLAEIHPDIPDWLAGIIGRLMTRDAADRFASAEEVAELLKECLAHVHQPGTVPLPGAADCASRPATTASNPGNQAASGSPPADIASGTVPTGRSGIIGAAVAGMALVTLAVVLLLEWNKGTLIIECDAGDIPIQVLSGGDVVEELTITRKATSIRIAAGQYVVKIDDEFDDVQVANGSVTVTRGEDQVVTISQRTEQPDATNPSRSGALPSGTATPSDAAPRPADSSAGAVAARDEGSFFAPARPRTGSVPASNQTPVRGKIIAIRDELVQVSIGTDDGIAAGTTLKVFRDDRYIGELQVAKPQLDSATARVRKQEQGHRLMSGDDVVGVIGSVSQTHQPQVVSGLGGGTLLPSIGEVTTAQLLFAGPKGSQLADLSQPEPLPAPILLPGRVTLQTKSMSRFLVSDLPGRAGMAIFPTIELPGTTPHTRTFLAHNSVPIEITEEDIDQVSSGNLVTKVVYLPKTEFAEIAVAGVDSLVSTRLDPGIDPVMAAHQRGYVLAVIRLGNRKPSASKTRPLTGRASIRLPQRPIYGGRNSRTGSPTLNPEWAEPAYDLLIAAESLHVASDDQAYEWPLHVESRAEARPLIGIVIALLGEGRIAWRSEPRRQLVIETDMPGLKVAKVLLPMAAAELETGEPSAPAEKVDGEPTDVPVLRYQVQNLRSIGTTNLLSGEVHLFESARWFWDLSMSFAEEADIREAAAMQAEEIERLSGQGKTETLKQAQSRLAELLAQAEQVAAERNAEQTRRDQRRRILDTAKQLAAQVLVLKEEGRVADAAEVQSNLNGLLRGIDPDQRRIADLQEQIVDARSRGRHDIADRLNALAEELTERLDERYGPVADDTRP